LTTQVHKLLTEKFHASQECWTSNLRTREGLPAFIGVESEYADFTVDDPAVCRRITEWLTGIGTAGTERWVGCHVAYHFEVKATANRCAEAFSMSNAQMALVSTSAVRTECAVAGI